jgi:O-methyltransferase
MRKRPRRPPLRYGARGPGSLYRRLRSLQLLATRDRAAVLSFLRARYPVEVPLAERVRLVARFVRITNAIRSWHTQAELLAAADAILRLAGRQGLTVVECGAAKGASTAKLSLLAARAGGRLHVFDSFRGLPKNEERHTRLDGSGPVVFRAGAFSGRLPAVKRAVERFGEARVCEWHKGWFEETLPDFQGPVDVAVLDVDLLASTRTCLVHLFPKLRPGGVILTQDAHLTAVAELLGSERFWREEVGVSPPVVEGLGARKMAVIRQAPPLADSLEPPPRRPWLPWPSAEDLFPMARRGRSR